MSTNFNQARSNKEALEQVITNARKAYSSSGAANAAKYLIEQVKSNQNLYGDDRTNIFIVAFLLQQKKVSHEIFDTLSSNIYFFETFKNNKIFDIETMKEFYRFCGNTNDPIIKTIESQGNDLHDYTGERQKNLDMLRKIMSQKTTLLLLQESSPASSQNSIRYPTVDSYSASRTPGSPGSPGYAPSKPQTPTPVARPSSPPTSSRISERPIPPMADKAKLRAFLHDTVFKGTLTFESIDRYLESQEMMIIINSYKGFYDITHESNERHNVIVATYEATVNRMQRELDSLRREASTTRDQFSEISALRESATAAARQIAHLEQQLNAKTSAYDRLVEEHGNEESQYTSELNEALNILRQERITLQANVKHFEAEVDKWVSKAQKAEAAQQAQQLRINELQAAVEQGQDTIKKLQQAAKQASSAHSQTLANLQQELAKATSKGGQDGKNIEQLTTQLEAARSLNTKTNARAEELQRALTAKSRKLEQALSTAKEAQSQLALAKQEITTATDKLTKQQQTIEILNQNITEHLQTISTQKSTISDLQTAVNRESDRATHSESQLTHNKSLLQAAQVQVNSLQSELSQAKGTISSQLQEITSLTKDRNDFKTKYQDQQKQVSTLTAELRRANEAKTRAEQIATEAERNAAHAKQQLSELQRTVATASERAHAAQAKLSGYGNIEARTREAIASAEKLRSRAEQAEASARDLKIQADRAEARATEAELQLAQLSEQLRGKEQQIHEAAQRAKRTEQALAAQTQLLQETQDKLARETTANESLRTRIQSITSNHEQQMQQLQSQFAASQQSLQDLQSKVSSGDASAQAAIRQAQQRASEVEQQLTLATTQNRELQALIEQQDALFREQQERLQARDSEIAAQAEALAEAAQNLQDRETYIDNLESILTPDYILVQINSLMLQLFPPDGIPSDGTAANVLETRELDLSKLITLITSYITFDIYTDLHMKNGKDLMDKLLTLDTYIEDENDAFKSDISNIYSKFKEKNRWHSLLQQARTMPPENWDIEFQINCNFLIQALLAQARKMQPGQDRTEQIALISILLAHFEESQNNKERITPETDAEGQTKNLKDLWAELEALRAQNQAAIEAARRAGSTTRPDRPGKPKSPADTKTRADETAFDTFDIRTPRPRKPTTPSGKPSEEFELDEFEGSLDDELDGPLDEPDLTLDTDVDKPPDIRIRKPETKPITKPKTEPEPSTEPSARDKTRKPSAHMSAVTKPGPETRPHTTPHTPGTISAFERHREKMGDDDYFKLRAEKVGRKNYERRISAPPLLDPRGVGMQDLMNKMKKSVEKKSKLAGEKLDLKRDTEKMKLLQQQYTARQEERAAESHGKKAPISFDEWLKNRKIKGIVFENVKIAPSRDTNTMYEIQVNTAAPDKPENFQTKAYVKLLEAEKEIELGFTSVTPSDQEIDIVLENAREIWRRTGDNTITFSDFDQNPKAAARIEELGKDMGLNVQFDDVTREALLKWKSEQPPRPASPSRTG